MKKFVRIIAVVLNVLVVTAFLLTTVAGYISPSRCMLPSLLTFAYLPMLIVNVVFALIWLWFGRKECLISIAAIALRYPLLPLYLQLFGKPDMPEPDNDTLTVMSLNVRLFMGCEADMSQTADNARLFLNTVELNGPDVLCLQEFAAVKGMSLADSLRFMGYTEQYAAHTSRTGHPYSSVIFSREPITYVNSIGNGSKIYADIVKNGHTVRVICVHFESYRLNDSDREEIDRIAHGDMDSTTGKTVAKLKSTIRSHEAEWSDELSPLVQAASVPVIVAGDFNDIPSSHLYHSVRRNLDDAFVDAGRGMGVTFCGHDFPAFRIDYIFHSTELECTAFRRFRVKFSDHYPIMAAFNLQTKPTP
ncbi:MAG: endonuclease/exonuclease/phosphatase family protein [Bacteroidales bacterium]|nr:endonuclease/exonuclease/phosphatase family protein [Bacteroidales bacterium]